MDAEAAAKAIKARVCTSDHARVCNRVYNSVYNGVTVEPAVESEIESTLANNSLQ